MRRALSVLLVLALTFALAAPAAAMHFEMRGQLRVRSWYLDNYWPRVTDGNQKGDFEFVDQRFRVHMNWGLTQYVFLKARADINEGFWGSGIGQATEVAESNPATGLPVQGFSFQNIQAKESIFFDQMYMMFGWPGAPLWIVAGTQPVNWGPGVLVRADNRDRLKLNYRIGAWNLGMAYDKNIESFVQELQGAGSDSRNWGLSVDGTVAGWKVGAVYAVVLNESQPPGFVPGGLPAPLDNTFHVVDAFAIGGTGPVTWKAEAAYLAGEAGLKGRPKVDVEGWALYAGGFYYTGLTSWGLELAWNQGNDPDTADVEGALNFDYHSPFHSVVLFNGMDYQGYDNLARGVAGDIGLSNALALKGTVTASPTERLSLVASAVWARRDQVQQPERDDNLGFEIDIMGVYYLYDNLTLQLASGYLWAGDFYRNDDGSSVENPFVVTLGTEVKF